MLLDVLLVMGRRRVAPSARRVLPAPRSATSAAAVMALGFGLLGWLLGAPLTPLLLGHEHHDASGARYQHVDGSEGAVLAVALAAVLGAVAWAITLAVTLPGNARSQASVPPRGGTRWVAAAPAVLFLATQAPASDASCLLPLVVGTAIHALLGAGALALARGCTQTLTERFGVPRLSSQVRASSRELPLVVCRRTFPPRPRRPVGAGRLRSFPPLTPGRWRSLSGCIREGFSWFCHARPQRGISVLRGLPPPRRSHSRHPLRRMASGTMPRTAPLPTSFRSVPSTCCSAGTTCCSSSRWSSSRESSSAPPSSSACSSWPTAPR